MEIMQLIEKIYENKECTTEEAKQCLEKFAELNYDTINEKDKQMVGIVLPFVIITLAKTMGEEKNELAKKRLNCWREAVKNNHFKHVFEEKETNNILAEKTARQNKNSCNGKDRFLYFTPWRATQQKKRTRKSFPRRERMIERAKELINYKTVCLIKPGGKTDYVRARFCKKDRMMKVVSPRMEVYRW